MTDKVSASSYVERIERRWSYQVEPLRSSVKPPEGSYAEFDQVDIIDHGDDEKFMVSCYGHRYGADGRKLNHGLGHYVRIAESDLDRLLMVVDAPQSRRGFET